MYDVLDSCAPFTRSDAHSADISPSSSRRADFGRRPRDRLLSSFPLASPATFFAENCAEDTDLPGYPFSFFTSPFTDQHARRRLSRPRSSSSDRSSFPTLRESSSHCFYHRWKHLHRQEQRLGRVVPRHPLRASSGWKPSFRCPSRKKRTSGYRGCYALWICLSSAQPLGWSKFRSTFRFGESLRLGSTADLSSSSRFFRARSTGLLKTPSTLSRASPSSPKSHHRSESWSPTPSPS